MEYLDLTMSSAAANLACDEALLDACDQETGPEVLRFWEPRECFVVVGYANEVAREVRLEACRQAGIGVFRRCSGGGAVVQGPGCLNYTLVLNITRGGALDTIPAANRHIMERHRRAFRVLLDRPVEVRGVTDLTVGQRKFSGNAQRRKRRALIFHGTFLLRLDLKLMETYLTMPSRQPEYRQGRPHESFVANLNLPAPPIKEALRVAWAAEKPAAAPDCAALIAGKYSRDDWNLKR
jgi:lipoate-protein ligase A